MTGPRRAIFRDVEWETEQEWAARRIAEGWSDDLDPAEDVFDAAPRVVRCVLCGEFCSPGCGCDREQHARGARY